MDTIGGQYPFFFRNEMVKYKEIPISGLISYHMDDNELFMTNEKLGLSTTISQRENTAHKDTQIMNNRTTQLVNYNITAERKFKLSVLDWLTDGKPKLFRSPTEGNYIVRLMNTSLSPNETVGRMLHTFSSTGYEMAPCDLDNLSMNKLNSFDMHTTHITPETPIGFKQIVLTDFPEGATHISVSAENITNFYWDTIYPNSVNIQINGKIYTNMGVLDGLTTECSNIIIPYEAIAQGDTIKFNYSSTQKPTSIIETRVGGVAYNSTQHIDQICVVKDMSTNMSYPSYTITINGTTIDCSDGQVRYYYNIDSITKPAASGVLLYIYKKLDDALIIEGVE